MISKSTISFIRSLHLKKYRSIEGCFIVEGSKLVHEIIHSQYEIQGIYYLNDEGMDEYLKYNHSTVSEKEMDQISCLNTSSKVLAVVKMPETNDQIILPQRGLHLVLDHIQDPGNFGTIVRIADWFGIDSLICSNDSVEKYNPKVIQSAMGSIFRMKIFYTSLVDFMVKNTEGANLQVFATSLKGEEISESKLTKDALIVLGNESRGVSQLMVPFVNHHIKIKGYGAAESLNVAVAAGIVCHEFRKN